MAHTTILMVAKAIWGDLGLQPALCKAIALPQWSPGHWEHLSPGCLQKGIALFGKKVRSLPQEGIQPQESPLKELRPFPTCQDPVVITGHSDLGEGEST